MFDCVIVFVGGEERGPRHRSRDDRRARLVRTYTRTHAETQLASGDDDDDGTDAMAIPTRLTRPLMRFQGQ